MGRTTKFSFPVPGRRQKQAPLPSPVITAPLTKAQKILGTGGLNVDSTTDQSKSWETKSNTGISISVSESTKATGLGWRTKGEVVNEHRQRWEDESAILPWEVQSKGSRVDLAGNDMTTDASSMRRQRSSSTINTYYDSSKVPLSISQQTASSAMAKGLPSKASALLDMDGNYSMSATSKKKKPSRLDLSHLLPKSRSGRHLSPSDAVSQKGMVLGSDMITRSPSMMSASPDVTEAPSVQQQSYDRQPRKKPTLETLRERWYEPTPQPVQPIPQELRRKMRTSASAHELHSLYENYEERSFQEMMSGEPGQMTTDAVSPKSGTTPTTVPPTRGFLSPYSNLASRTSQSGKDTFTPQASSIETPASSLMTSSSLKSPALDCAASVSSRHTRTSKASKKTDRSMTDFDLRQNSVLSLSSDSEEDDDYSERPATSISTSLSAPRRPSDTSRRPSDSQASTTSAEISSFPQPPSPRSSEAARKASLPRRISPMSPMDFSDFAVYDNFPNAPGTDVQEPAARTSAFSLSSQGTIRPSRQHTSHFSLASTVTAASPSPIQEQHKASPARGSMRAIALIPAQGFPWNHRSSQLSNASDQHVPASPTSIDFFMQSQHNSMAFDNGSIRSGMSAGGGSSIRGSVNNGHGYDGDGDGRFIAVTAQEERLLAALRIKKARMRDQMIAEFGEEQDGTADPGVTVLHHPRLQPLQYDPSSPTQHLTSAPPSQPLPTPPRNSRASSDPKRPSSRQMSRFSSMNTTRLAPLPEQPQTENQQQMSASTSPETLPNSRFSPFTRVSIPAGADKQEPLMYGDQSIAKLGALDVAESSPDLDGSVSFDNGIRGSIVPDFPSVPSETSSSTSTSRSKRSQTSSSRSDVPAQPSTSSLSVPKAHDSRRTRIDSILTSYLDHPRTSVAPAPREKKDTHVPILEDVTEASNGQDDYDMPRPDSPISPVPDFPLPASSLPRKKQVRLSAVGYKPMEADWWADDG